jgi:hypothetical protein
MSIDYANPSLYLQGGTQSTLTAANAALINAHLPAASRDLAGIARIHEWVRSGFASEAAGGRTIGITGVNDLFRIKVRDLGGSRCGVTATAAMLDEYRRREAADQAGEHVEGNAGGIGAGGY